MLGTSAQTNGVRLSSRFRTLCIFLLTSGGLAFLSYLKLSVYMAVVSVAIVMPFHLQSKPTDLELRMAKPLGAIFCALSLACLLVGCANYMSEYTAYGSLGTEVEGSGGDKS